jgi:histone H1/5|tara:strand:+ start:2920 stop:3366 length:447 start_codon:yes stop_codon:yes gene_type:complete
VPAIQNTNNNYKMPPKAAAHPKYEDMVKAAILALKDRNGSSVPAIAKYLAANYKLPDNFKKILSTQLKNLVKSGKLLKVKASYKLGEALKKAPKKPKKKAAPKKKKAAKKPKKKAVKKPKKAAKKAAKKPKKAAKKPKKATKKSTKKK